MTLVEAITWLREQKAVVLFGRDRIVVEVGSNTSGVERTTGKTIEEAVVKQVQRKEEV